MMIHVFFQIEKPAKIIEEQLRCLKFLPTVEGDHMHGIGIDVRTNKPH